ncbi:MAG: acetamidase/formamidase family protein [Acidobacteriia bacterium]|jgi:acetamidase/formamidase|nr:acetamidase/formamidase family protein [Terriglobia bacterium]
MRRSNVFLRWLCLLTGAALLAPGLSTGQRPVKRYEPPAGSGVPTFAVREPVLRLQPGDVVETRTLSGGYYEVPGGEWPGEVGPFYIEGATPNDTLVVKILRLRPNRDTAVSTHTPGFISAVAGDRYTRVLNDPIPARRYVWRLDRQRNLGILDLPASARRLEVPLRPMLGRVAVAPEGAEAFGGLWPGNFGGNMDAADVTEGVTVYLPIFHDGALFYFGDFHALQGDAEICGSGLESTAEVTFQFDLIKGKRIAWPRLENETHIMVVGSARPLDNALRIAAVEMIEWLVADYGFDKWDAYQTVSQLTEMRIANMVDPLYSVVVRMPKQHLQKP